MKLLVLAVLVLIGLPVLLLAAGLVANRAPLLDPPGPVQRMRAYLTANVAETAPDAPFPELRAPLFNASPEVLIRAVETASHRLGWRLGAVDRAQGTLTAVVTTALWRFKDDVEIRVLPAPEGGAMLQVRSASRVGKADLGANARHILDLLEAVQDELP